MDMQPPVGPRLPRRESDWVPLPDPYAGFSFRFWLNAPQRLWNDVQSGDDERGKAALTKIVLEHNNWNDTDGTVFPAAGDVACWDAIPTELLAVVLVICNAEMMKLPNSLVPRTKRR